MNDSSVIKGYPVSATSSIVYEPVLSTGGHIVTIKYKYSVNICVNNVAPYITSITHKVHSEQLKTQDKVQEYIGSQVLHIHNIYPTAKIISIDVTSKE